MQRALLRRMSTARLIVASNFKDAAINAPQVGELGLRSSPDLACSNLMCGQCVGLHAELSPPALRRSRRFGGPCVCKLARWIWQTAPRLANLHKLDLSANKLTTLPCVVFSLPALAHLDVSGMLAATPQP